jgi:hypothetical protein
VGAGCTHAFVLSVTPTIKQMPMAEWSTVGMTSVSKCVTATHTHHSQTFHSTRIGVDEWRRISPASPAMSVRNAPLAGCARAWWRIVVAPSWLLDISAAACYTARTSTLVITISHGRHGWSREARAARGRGDQGSEMHFLLLDLVQDTSTYVAAHAAAAMQLPCAAA